MTADFPGEVVQETVVDTPASTPAAESADKQYDLNERKPDEGYLDFKERRDREDAIARGEIPPDRKPGDEKKRGRYQARISELTAKLRAAERDRDAAAAYAQHAARPIQSPPHQQLTFEQSEKLRLRQAMREEQATQFQEHAQAQHEAALHFRNQTFAAKVEAAQDRFPDLWNRFDAVPCSQFAADFIVNSDKTIEIAHFLASNPREAARISRLPNEQQGIALARIEGRISAAPASRRVSNMPAPPRRVSGGTWSGAREPHDMDYESFKRMMDDRERKELK
jgi:hypothetical protein